MSFFFGPFPKLLLRDQEKKIPRFLSAFSSRLSSFSDLPDRCFVASYWLQNKRYIKYKLLMMMHNDLLLKIFFEQSRWNCWHLFRSGECGAVWAGAVLRGSGAAGDMVGVRQGLTIHFRTYALLVKGRLEESWVAIKLHQVEDLGRGHN